MGFELYSLEKDFAQMEKYLSDENCDQQIYKDTVESLTFLVEQETDKVLQYGTNLKTQEEMVASEIQRLQKLKKVISNKRTKYKEIIFEFMKSTGLQNIKTAFGTMYRRSNESMQIEAGADIPEEFISYSPKVDKTALKSYVKSGKKVKGISFVTNESLGMR